MKFAALISGGKDSTFSILDCLNQGHELVALLNLHPPSNCGKDELDSYMFQSVGHEAINYISDAIGDIPLYRSEINGTAISTELQYTAVNDNSYNIDDEVEDLYKIISVVKNDFPDLKAISTGAILSNYQRTRVENVCSRLGLISLAYMWQCSQVNLLKSMIRCRMDPIIIKIAALGLNEKMHLGKSLQASADDIIKKSKEYGLNPCGEGGEYESLTLDAPYFQKRIEIVDSRVITLDEDDFACVKYLKIDKMRLVEKMPSEYRRCNEFFGSDLCASLNLGRVTDPTTTRDDLEAEFDDISDRVVRWEPREEQLEGPIVKILTTTHLLDAVTCGTKAACVESMKGALVAMQALLDELGATSDQVVYSILCVPDMTLFGAVNDVYGAFFPSHNLPSRTCIETNQRDRLSLHCYVNCGAKYSRNNMHIQSFSHWAPASIGPYSQAVALLSDGDLFCFLSGQIGMHPEDLRLIEAEIEQECLLSLRHVSRVAWAHASLSWVNLSAMVCYCVNETHLRSSRRVFHSSICCHPDHGQCLCSRVSWVVVQRLPKDANVEWQPIFSRNQFIPTSSESGWDDCIVFTTDVDSQITSSSCAVISIDSYLDGDDLVKSGFIRINF